MSLFQIIVFAPSFMAILKPDVVHIPIGTAAMGTVFDGVGGLSAGAGTRLLVDYPVLQRDWVLDLSLIHI